MPENFATLTPRALQARARDWQPTNVVLVADESQRWERPNEGWPWVSLREWARDHVGHLIKLQSVTGSRYARISLEREDTTRMATLTREDVERALESFFNRHIRQPFADLLTEVVEVREDLSEMSDDIQELHAQTDELEPMLAKFGINMSDFMGSSADVGSDERRELEPRARESRERERERDPREREERPRRRRRRRRRGRNGRATR